MEPGDAARDLERLPGVLAATLFLDTPGPPRAYLAVGPDADPVTLRHTAAALLRDRGYLLPTDRIHVGLAPPRRTAGALPRITLDGLDVHRSENRVECTVRIRSESHTTYGTCAEPDSASGRARAAARAALQAAEALDPDFRFGLQGVRPLDLFGHDALVVLVDASAGRGHAYLPGAAAVRERSVEEAAALAALHALRGWVG